MDDGNFVTPIDSYDSSIVNRLKTLQVPLSGIDHEKLPSINVVIILIEGEGSPSQFVSLSFLFIRVCFHFFFPRLEKIGGFACRTCSTTDNFGERIGQRTKVGFPSYGVSGETAYWLPRFL
jgi:hypothetical protein